MHRGFVMQIRLLLVFMFAAGAGHAKMTVAWMMPVEIAELHFPDLPPPLEKHPGNSAFFQPGDKLFDVSGSVNLGLRLEAGDNKSSVPAETGWRGDWIVWNSRSGMIVAHGSWNDIQTAEDVGGFGSLIPMVVRTQVELTNVHGTRNLSFISRSGEKSAFEFEGLKAVAEIHASERIGAVIDNRVEITWSAKAGEAPWAISTAVSCRDGHRINLARHGQDDHKWNLTMVTTRESTDGTPWLELRSIESPNGVVPWVEDIGPGDAVRVKCGPRQWVGIFQLEAAGLDDLLPPEDSASISTVDAPAIVLDWVHGELADVRQPLIKKGIDFGGDSQFAGVDRRGRRLFVLGSESDLDIVGEAVELMHAEDADPPIWIETNPESGGWGLACQSGEMAEIRKAAEKDPDNLLFRIEPTRGGSGSVFDLRYEFDVVGGAAPTGHLMSSTTLARDKPQLIGSGKARDGKGVEVRVTASNLTE